MGDLTRHFDSHEFACRCGCTAPDSIRLRWFEIASALEKVRDIVGRSITVISGYRCPKRNAQVPNAARHSEHLRGDAVDIEVYGWPGERLRGVFETLIAQGEIADGGLGTYEDRPLTCHYDLGSPRRW